MSLTTINFSSISVRLTYAILLTGLLYSCQYNKPEEISAAQKDLPQVIDFNFHVKPILSDKCFVCHGPDIASQKANLRLDTSEGAFTALTSGNGFAIKPGNLKKSQAFIRMISADRDFKMPPPESHLELTTAEIAILAKWIEQGAQYKPHWSFIPPTKPGPPMVKNEQLTINPIDRFILNRLEKEVTLFSKSAEKETLIRRASFSLVGLPPTMEEIDEFINNNSPNAYEKVIDRLLASPAYGERMAVHWMDVARYTDSDGYLDDKHRDFSPYRDWVINSFNRNMPYDQFVTWQLAGDLIPDATQESILATAFNRLHRRNSEAGIVFEEYRVEYVADRTNTFGKAFLGLSLECARCHDHKYDPITQMNYYELFGFFNSTNELGTAVYGQDQTPGPSLMLTSEVEQDQLDSLQGYITNLENKKLLLFDEQAYKKWTSTLSKQTIQKSLSDKLVAHYPFDEFIAVATGQFLSPEDKKREGNAEFKEPIVGKGKIGNAFFSSDYNTGKLGSKVGWFERSDPFSLELWVYPDTIYENSHILWHCEDLRLGLKGYTISLIDNKVNFMMSHSWPHNALQVSTKRPLQAKEWTHLTVTYNGSSKARGVKIYLNGEEAEIFPELDNLYKGILYEKNIHTYGFKGLTIGTRDKFTPFKKGGLDELKVYNNVLSSLEVKHSYGPTGPDNLYNTDNPLVRDYFIVNNQSLKALESDLRQTRVKENTLANNVKEIMVMGDLPNPRPTYILDRGVYSNQGEKVQPGTPASILPFDESLPKNRLGLAQWLFDQRNPLTARVFVNRIWQLHFGTGLVKTSEDLGNQGDLPSHPELLDWLALELINSGWDIKHIHKLIVMSATFRQHSFISPEWGEKDPENVLLARGPAFRLSAEMIRDNALSISGLLEENVGGPSVYPYQPAGLWNELTTKSWAYRYPDDATDGIYRRSLYTFWKRTSPPPYMQIFDIANRDLCTVRRKPTNTPLHALVLLNDPQFIEAARALAEKTLSTEKEETAQIESVFRLCTGRKPTLAEFSTLMEFYQKELAQFEVNRHKAMDYLNIGKSEWNHNLNPVKIAALGVVTNAIMNTDEAHTRR